ncbi:hypothetical protein ACFL6F_03220 [Planctomycetota bacterium]
MIKYIRIGIISLGLFLTGTLAYTMWSAYSRNRLEKTAMGTDVIAAREAVVELAGKGDDRSVHSLIRIFGNHPDRSVVEITKILLLKSNNMMPEKPFPKYEYILEDPVFSVNGKVLILTDGKIPEWIQDLYINAIVKRLGIPVWIEKYPFDFNAQEYPYRKQYEMTGMLGKVFRHISGRGGKVVLVTDKDTFVKGQKWDTGCSAVYGPGSVVSIKRLNPEFWGNKKDLELYKKRLTKVLLHELAHTLIPSDKHCKRWGCLLHKTESLGDIDKLPLYLCPVCEALQEQGLKAIQEYFLKHREEEIVEPKHETEERTEELEPSTAQGYIRWLYREEPEKRETAIAKLPNFKQKKPIIVIHLKLLQQWDPLLRDKTQAAIRKIGGLNREHVLDLVQLFQNINPQIQRHALNTIENMGTTAKEAAPYIENYLRRDPVWEWSAKCALNSINRHDTIAEFTPDSEVSELWAKIQNSDLGNLNRNDMENLAGKAGTSKQALLCLKAALSKFSKEVNHIRIHNKRLYSQVRQELRNAYRVPLPKGIQLEAEDLPLLIYMLKEGDSCLKREAMNTLILIGTYAKAAIPELKRIANGSEGKEIQSLAETTVEIVSGKSIPYYFNYMKEFREKEPYGPHDKENMLKQKKLIEKIYQELGGGEERKGEKALSVIKHIDQLYNENAYKRLKAVISLGDMGKQSRSSVIFLRLFLKWDNKLKRDILAVLKKIGPFEGEDLVHLVWRLNHINPEIRKDALLGIAEIGKEATKALPIVEELMERDRSKIVRRTAKGVCWKLKSFENIK